MFRRIFLLASLLLTGLAASPAGRAARVEFDVQPRVIEQGEQAEATILVQGAGQNATPALQVPQGLHVDGQSQSFTLGPDGAVMQFKYVLSAKRTGRFTIGPFTYKLGSESFELPAVTLEVKAPGERPRREGETKVSDLMFITLQASKDNPVTQEPFELTLSLYTNPRINLTEDYNLENMDVTGMKLGGWMRIGTTRENLRGQPWNVRRFRAQVRPLRAGDFSLRPSLQVNVIVPRRDAFGSVFDLGPLAGAFNETRPFMLTAEEPLVVKVQDPPAEGRPAEYRGTVGTYEFHADITPAEVTAGDPVTLRVAIAGRGNLDAISAPEPSLDNRFKAYDTKTASRELNEAGTAGKLVFEKVLIPLSDAVTEVPAVAFPYFDPATGAYRTATAGPFPLKVKPGAAEPARGPLTAAVTTGAQKAVVGEDIVYLQNAPGAWRRVQDLRAKPSIGARAVHALPVVALLAATQIARNRRRLQTDTGYARRRAAPRLAQAGLAQARQALQAGQASAALEGVWKAVTGYCANRLDVGPGDVDAALLRTRLGARPELTDLASRLADTLDTCDAARFGGAPAAVDSAWVDRVENLLLDLERFRGTL